MALFIANLLPFFAFLWSLSLLLFYRTMYREYTNKDEITEKLIVPYAAIAFTSLMIILPIRTCINKCFENEGTDENNETYEQNVLKFITDYDRENPITKHEASIKFLEKRIGQAKNDEDKARLEREK